MTLLIAGSSVQLFTGRRASVFLRSRVRAQGGIQSAHELSNAAFPYQCQRIPGEDVDQNRGGSLSSVVDQVIRGGRIAGRVQLGHARSTRRRPEDVPDLCRFRDRVQVGRCRSVGRCAPRAGRLRPLRLSLLVLGAPPTKCPHGIEGRARAEVIWGSSFECGQQLLGALSRELALQLATRPSSARSHRVQGACHSGRAGPRRIWRAPSLGFRPPIRPRRRAAARPSKVRSDASAPSNSAMDPSIWKNIRPAAVEVSIPWSRTTRSTPRV